MRLAFGYGRVSQLAAGQEGSLPTQRHKVALAAELGSFEVIEWFDDPDISAFSGKRRPGYEAMMRRLPEVRGGAIIFYRLDRFCRRLSQFTAAWEECGRHDVALISATEPIDTSTPIGLAMMEILMVFAQLEARTTQVRLRDHHATLAVNGKYKGGPDPLGWRYDHETKEVAIDPPGQAAVREMVAAALSGVSARQIADWLNEGTIAAPIRGRWDHSGVLRLLRSPRLVGDRTHNGDVTKRDAFPPLIDRVTHAKLQAVLRTRKPGRPAAPLTGLVICGACLQPMRAGSGAVRSYACLYGPCERKSGVSCAKLERHVGEKLIEKCESEGFGKSLAAAHRQAAVPPSSEKEMNDLRDRRLRLQEAWDRGERSGDYYLPKFRELTRRIEELALAQPAAVVLPKVSELRAAVAKWWDLPADRQRYYLHALIREVVIPPKRGRGPHDLTPITPVWRW